MFRHSCLISSLLLIFVASFILAEPLGSRHRRGTEAKEDPAYEDFKAKCMSGINIIESFSNATKNCRCSGKEKMYCIEGKNPVAVSNPFGGRNRRGTEAKEDSAYVDFKTKCMSGINIIESFSNATKNCRCSGKEKMYCIEGKNPVAVSAPGASKDPLFEDFANKCMSGIDIIESFSSAEKNCRCSGKGNFYCIPAKAPYVDEVKPVNASTPEGAAPKDPLFEEFLEKCRNGKDVPETITTGDNKCSCKPVGEHRAVSCVSANPDKQSNIVVKPGVGGTGV